MNRQKAFKEAAVEAKKKGDKDVALEMLRNMKKLQPLIEQAKNGLKVDIKNVPQPPLLRKNFDLDESSSDKHSVSRQQSTEEDESLYIRLLNSLREQVKVS